MQKHHWGTLNLVGRLWDKRFIQDVNQTMISEANKVTKVEDGRFAGSGEVVEHLDLEVLHRLMAVQHLQHQMEGVVLRPTVQNVCVHHLQ